MQVQFLTGKCICSFWLDGVYGTVPVFLIQLKCSHNNMRLVHQYEPELAVYCVISKNVDESYMNKRTMGVFILVNIRRKHD